ncbi:MAG: hypothetical protein FJ356_01620 [Thaumarchaeota archaeon]|nr:hypothetical protein [Nitrososphaerota archaeon]
MKMSGDKVEKIQLSDILSKMQARIKLIDDDITRFAYRFQGKYREVPTTADYMNDPYISRLIRERKALINKYSTLVKKSNTVNVEQPPSQKSPEQIILDKQIKSASSKKNPFDSYIINNIPKFAPMKNILTDMKNRGTLWDPSFNLTSMSPTPYMKKYYKNIKRYW